MMGSLVDTRVLVAEYTNVDGYKFDEAALDIPGIRAAIDARGFAVVRELVPRRDVDAIRSYWLDAFARVRGAPRVNWSPYLGEANSVGYTEDGFQCLYRSCDFLWNDPYHPVARGAGIYLNVVRNLVLGNPVLDGLVYAPGRYGVFVTASYYPPGRGWLKGHADGVADRRPLVHHILPLTFKGADYRAGGLYLVDRSGARVDVDAALEPGSAVFYDGSLVHGVDRVEPHPGRDLGRLQLFAIPTSFMSATANDRIYDQLPVSGYIRRRALLLRNRIAHLLGRDAVIR